MTAGARFILSPSLDVEVIRFTRDLGAVSVPGAFTATEILTAYRAGGVCHMDLLDMNAKVVTADSVGFWGSQMHLQFINTLNTSGCICDCGKSIYIL